MTKGPTGPAASTRAHCLPSFRFLAEENPYLSRATSLSEANSDLRLCRCFLFQRLLAVSVSVCLCLSVSVCVSLSQLQVCAPSILLGNHYKTHAGADRNTFSCFCVHSNDDDGACLKKTDVEIAPTANFVTEVVSCVWSSSSLQGSGSVLPMSLFEHLSMCQANNPTTTTTYVSSPEDWVLAAVSLNAARYGHVSNASTSRCDVFSLLGLFLSLSQIPRSKKMRYFFMS